MKQRLIRCLCLALGLLLVLMLCACGKAAGAPESSAAPASSDIVGTESTSEAPTEPASASLPEPETDAATEPAQTEAPESVEPETDPVTEQPETAAAPEITTGKHPREEGYPSVFNVSSLSLGACTVHMEERIFTEPLLVEAARQIRTDLDTVLTYTGETERPLEVYIVARVGSGHKRIIDNRMFCTQAEWESGAYRTGLIRVACGLPHTWQAVGLSGLLFEEPAAETELSAWYQSEAHTNQLSLAEPFFSEALTDPETLRMSELTAQSVTADFLSRADYEAFRDLEQTQAAVAPWAEAVLGMEELLLPAGADAVERLEFLESTDSLLVLKADEPMNHFLWELKTTNWLTNAEDAYQLICRFYAGYAELLEVLERQLPETFPQIRENVERDIRINLVNSNVSSFASTERGQIELASGISLWHEVLHFLLPLANDGPARSHWESEGLADYYSLPIETKYSVPVYGRYRYLTGDEYESEYADQPMLRAHRETVIRYYTALSPLPQSAEDMDYNSFSKALALIGLMHPEIRLPVQNGLTKSIAAVAGLTAGPKDKDGDGLSYPEAELMVEYLISQYGEAAYVSGYLTGEDPETRLGPSYPELYENFLEWIRTEYPFVND